MPSVVTRRTQVVKSRHYFAGNFTVDVRNRHVSQVAMWRNRPVAAARQIIRQAHEQVDRICTIDCAILTRDGWQMKQCMQLERTSRSTSSLGRPSNQASQFVALVTYTRRHECAGKYLTSFARRYESANKTAAQNAMFASESSRVTIRTHAVRQANRTKCTAVIHKPGQSRR